MAVFPRDNWEIFLTIAVIHLAHPVCLGLHTFFNLHIILTLGGKCYHPQSVGRKPRFGEAETLILTHTASQRTGAHVDVIEKLGCLPPFQISFQATFFQLCRIGSWNA